MKKRLTKYLAVLCVLACMLSLSGCGSKEEKNEKVTYSEDTEKAVKKLFQGQLDADTTAEQVMSFVLEYTSTDRGTLEDQYKEYVDNGEEDDDTAKIVSSYLNATEGIGDYQDDYYNLELEVDDSDNSINLTGTMAFEKRQVMFNCSLTLDSSGQINSLTIAYEKDLTTGEILAKAGKNTLLGMGTVFLLLIVISAIISCLKLANNDGKEKTAAEPARKAEPAAVQKPVETAVVPSGVTEDEELAAVIAAAIAASEGTSTDGFVVRSIKRVNNAKWRNA